MSSLVVYSLTGGLLSPVLSQSLDQMYRKKLIDAANYEKHLYDLVGKSTFSANCTAAWQPSVDCARNPEKCTVKHPIREFIYIAPDGKIQSVMVDRSFNSTNNKPYREHYLGVLNKTVPDPEVNSTERYLRNGKTNDYYRATTLLKIEKNSGFDLLVKYLSQPYYFNPQSRLRRYIRACKI